MNKVPKNQGVSSIATEVLTSRRTQIRSVPRHARGLGADAWHSS
jgi:hypothetical protein